MQRGCWRGFWHQIAHWSRVWRHKSALFVKMEAGKRYLEASSKKMFPVRFVCGLASRTTSCLTKRMLGDGDRENAVAIVSSFFLSTLIQGKRSNQLLSSFIVLINVDPMVFILCSLFNETSAGCILSFIYFHLLVYLSRLMSCICVFSLFLFFVRSFFFSLSLICSFCVSLSTFKCGPQEHITFDLCCHGSSAICSTGNAK